MRRSLAALLGVLTLLSCQQPLGVGDDVADTIGDPLYAIADAAHSLDIDNFYFLPPMVPAPAYGGVFDAARNPAVEICLFDTSTNACAETQPWGGQAILFTMDTGPGSETVRLSTEDEHYIVNWHTDEFGVDPESTYRIHILEPGPLGYADVIVGENGRDLKNVNTDEFVPLVDGRTLPIKFRIEEGLPFVLDDSGGEITAAGGEVVLDVPAGAVAPPPGGGDPEPIEVTVDEVPADDPSLPEGAGGLEGTVYDLGPDGTVFAEPVELTFSYDPEVLTAANPEAREEDLALFVLEDGIWVPLDNISVDPVTNEVSGFTTHFSQFGVLTKTRVCPGGGGLNFATVQEAYDATIPGGAIELCEDPLNPHVVEGVVLDAPVSIRPQGSAAPVIQTDTARAAFWLNGYSTGTVLIDGVTFDFNSPDGTDIPTRSYAIRAQVTYDQLIVQNTTFDIDGLSRGSIFVEASTVPTAATFLDNVVVNGGVYGLTVADSDGWVTNSAFTDVGRAVYYFTQVSMPSTGSVEASSFDCWNLCVRVGGAGGAQVDVLDNAFGQCGAIRCVSAVNGATSDVLRNTFAAPNVIQNDTLNQDQIIGVYSGSDVLVQDNVLEGCGYWTCIDVSGGSAATISNNQFTHLAANVGVEWDFASIFDLRRGANIIVENNTLLSCGGICYKVLDGATATIRNEIVNTPSGHGTMHILVAAEDDPASPDNTITFEDNSITGSGAETGAGIFTPTTATVNRNTFTTLLDGVVVDGGSTLTGRDNEFTLSGGGVFIHSGFADFRFNDFTGQSTGIADGGDGTSDLTCNYWGDVAGPEIGDPGLPREMYWPWALTEIAGTGATDCDGATLRVAAADDGSGLPFVPTIAEAVSIVPPNGTILVSDGTHSAEGVVVDHPMTIMAESGTPVLQTSTEANAFRLDGYDAGTVVFDGLAFDFSPPTPAPDGSATYAISAGGTYDQLVVQNSSFNVDPASRGGIVASQSTVAGAATSVDNVVFTGGQRHVSAIGTHVDVTNSDLSGSSNISLSILGDSAFAPTGAASGYIADNTFADCGTRCVRPSWGAIVDVLTNDFGQCGSVRCVSIGRNALVEVSQNTFAAPVLTGVSDPDQNQIIGVYQGSNVLVDGNVLYGCGFWTCIDVSGGSTATISSNEFSHVAGQTEWDHASIFDLRFGSNVTVENNTLHSCGIVCYKVLDGTTATIRNEDVTVVAGHDTDRILEVWEDDPASPGSTVLFEDNAVTGVGGERAVSAGKESSVTVTGNTFMTMLSGVAIHEGATVTGSDNVFTLSGTAIAIYDGFADFRFNDFTGQVEDIGPSGDGTSDLTCNYWGNAAGPQAVAGGVPSTIYTPWATAAVANTGASGCSGS